MEKSKFSLFTLLILAAIFSFTSCSDDDDDNDNNSIIGTWIFEKGIVSKMESTFSEEDNAKIKKHYEDNAKYYGIYIIKFNADGTCTEKDIDSEGESDKRAYKFENDKLFVGDEGDEDVFDAEIKNGVLTIYYDESDEYCEPSVLIEAGITDPYHGVVSDFIGKIEYSRQ